MFQGWHIWLLQRFWPNMFRGRGIGLFRLRNGISFKIDYSRTNVGTFQEVWLMDLYQRYYRIRPGDVVVDIGASFGPFAVLAAKNGAKVYAYEPTPRQFNFLLENTRGLPVVCYNLAVSGKSGETKIYEAQGSDEGNSPIYQNHMKPTPFIAKAITLPEILGEAGRCNLLKIDCEGCELDILRRTPKEIFACVDNIAMEYHDNLQEITKIFETLDYKFVAEGGKYGYLYAWR